MPTAPTWSCASAARAPGPRSRFSAISTSWSRGGATGRWSRLPGPSETTRCGAAARRTRSARSPRRRSRRRRRRARVSAQRRSAAALYGRRALGDGDYELDIAEPKRGLVSAADTPLRDAIEGFLAEHDPGAQLVPARGYGDCDVMRPAFGCAALRLHPARRPHYQSRDQHGADEQRILVADLEFQTRAAIALARTIGALDRSTTPPPRRRRVGRLTPCCGCEGAVGLAGAMDSRDRERAGVHRVAESADRRALRRGLDRAAGRFGRTHDAARLLGEIRAVGRYAERTRRRRHPPSRRRGGER